MGKIKILSEEVKNRITAGEVIERPFSAVKEMIENCIDAGATEIEIRIERGGKDLIEITDNGCGIAADDLRAALIPHATSKIESIEDIDHIHTLGFRGEALASIAAIAKVELISAVDGGDAHKVFSDGMLVGKVEPAVAPKGTTIKVTDFFFNTPVRFKFMKSDKKEQNDITAYVMRYILGNPHIAFGYYVDGKLLLKSYGGSEEEAVTLVYGADCLPNCFKISAERNDIKVSGLISNQNYFKANKTYQTIFLNGRYVVNPIISSAIHNAYSAYAMKKYPFYVLNIEMPDDIVDVNVHPNKTDVRFVDNSLVYGTIYKIISSILDGTSTAAEYVVDGSDGKGATEVVQSGSSPSFCAAEFVTADKVYDRDFSGVKGIEAYLKKTAAEKKQLQPATQLDLCDYGELAEHAPRIEDGAPVPDATKDLKLYEYYGMREGAEPEVNLSVCKGAVRPMRMGDEIDIEEKVREDKKLAEYRQSKYRGTLFNTYLIYEIKDEVFLIDQHAAHERLLYDKLIKQFLETNMRRQGLLVPYLFNVNPQEKAFIEANLDTLYQLGFMIESFGANSYRVNSVPAEIKDVSVKGFIDEILSNIDELKRLEVTDIVKEKFAQTACKHAVKGGELLTELERDTLFSMLKNNFGLKCPHGRPICVKLTRNEIEKMFKRKV